MSNQKKIAFLLGAFAVIFFAPYAGAYTRFGGIPEGYINFPPMQHIAKPPATAWSVAVNVILFAAVLLLFFFPQLYGFRKPPVSDGPKPEPHHRRLPYWFWIGLLMWAGTLILLTLKVSHPKIILYWAIIPLCWGFAFFLDGATYYRTGRSLVRNAPTEMIAMGVISISGWLIFEYLNFFIRLNWIYPMAGLVKSHDEYLLYAVLGSSGWIPLAFEWYYFLASFRSLDEKYKYGPKVSMGKGWQWFLLLLSAASLFLAPYHPFLLFFVIWLGPLLILCLSLSLAGIRTPFTSIKMHGDWSPIVIFGMTFLLQGIMVEWWNFMSADKLPGGEIYSFNPAYWQYTIPYVLDYKVFEMPLLGYLGYVPFGIYCWVYWIFWAFLIDINTSHTLKGDFR